MLYGTIITAKGKTKINSVVSITGATISIVLNIVFLPKFGLITAALVSSLAMTVMLFISIWYAELKISHSRPVFSLLLVASVIYIMVYMIPIDNIVFSIILKSIVSLLVVIGISLILAINPLKFVNGFMKK
jgi:O-antigen/teichoic acid export membrane protein